jgi:hypothetical protein
MATLGKKARVAHVCLAALLALLAGAPRVQCRCPDGRFKPFCLGFLFHNAGPAGCCGATGPYPSQATQEPEAAPPCCCAGSHDVPVKAAENPCHVDGAGCVRTLTQAGDFAPAPSEKETAAPTVAAPLFAPAAFAPLPAERGLLSWQAHLLAPPPTDLITVLQRLTN